MPIAPALPAIFAGASAVATGVAAYGQYKASRSAAAVDEATAQHNAQIDRVQANQLDLDTQQNIRTERQENSVYLSNQAASYAAAGVLSTSASPLHAQIVNAGRMEQKIQQEYVNSQQRQQSLYSQATLSIAEGQARAKADRNAGNLALIDGAAKMAGMAFMAFGGGLGGSLSSAGGVPDTAEAYSAMETMTP
jgi:hypothetical protein